MAGISVKKRAQSLQSISYTYINGKNTTPFGSECDTSQWDTIRNVNFAKLKSWPFGIIKWLHRGKTAEKFPTVSPLFGKNGKSSKSVAIYQGYGRSDSG